MSTWCQQNWAKSSRFLPFPLQWCEQPHLCKISTWRGDEIAEWEYSLNLYWELSKGENVNLKRFFRIQTFVFTFCCVQTQTVKSEKNNRKKNLVFKSKCCHEYKVHGARGTKELVWNHDLNRNLQPKSEYCGVSFSFTVLTNSGQKIRKWNALKSSNYPPPNWGTSKFLSCASFVMV